jgi:hypothetical protein
MKLRKGDRVQRSSLAIDMLKAIGIHAPNTGTVTGWSRGKFAGCLSVRVDGSGKAEPFHPDLWETQTE